MSTEWIRDGHGVRCYLERDTLDIAWECPNQTPVIRVDWADLPHCRRPYTEYGEPELDGAALPYCNIGEWVTNVDDGVLSLLDADVMYGQRVPVHPLLMVGYRWDGDNYLWAPSTAIDRSASLSADVVVGES